MWTALGRGLGLQGLAGVMASQPARLAGVEGSKGAIAAGMDADLVVFAPEEKWTVTTEDLRFRHAVSPYVGRTLTGRVKRTILRGQTVFENGQFVGEPMGREVRP